MQFIYQNVYVVDEDEKTLKLIENALKDKGSEQVTSFAQGEECWEALRKNPTVDLMIMDWNMEDLPGPALFNRIRMDERLNTIPVIVTSTALEQKDFKLVSELSLASLVRKPLQTADLTLHAHHLHETSKKQKEFLEKLTPVFANFDEDPKGSGAKIMSIFSQKAQSSAAILRMITEFFMEKEAYSFAEEVLVAHLKDYPESMIAINQLGKVYFKMKNYKNAIKVLEKANEVSEQSVSRLLLLGDINMQALDLDKAEDYYDKVLRIDKENFDAISNKEGVGTLREHRANVDMSDIPRTLASILNTQAIVATRNKEYEKGRNLYNSAIKFISDKLVRAKINYNLGLSFLRDKKDHDAIRYLTISAKEGGTEFTKAAALLEKQGIPAPQGQATPGTQPSYQPDEPKKKVTDAFQKTFGGSDDDEISEEDLQDLDINIL